MRVGIVGSMQFTERMIEVRDQLRERGIEAYVTNLHTAFIGKNDDEIETIKIHQKNNLDAIREFWRAMQGGDAILVLNLDKNGIKKLYWRQYFNGNWLCACPGPENIFMESHS